MEPRRYFGGPMDAGRYMPRHGGWDSNSAVESYKGAPDAEVRAGEAYGGRNFLESGVSQDNAYSRGTLHRDPFVERDGFQMPPQPAVGMWPDARRKTLEEELAILRNAPRHDKGGGYFEGYNQVGDFRESDKFPRQIDYYHNRGSNVHDHGSFRDTDGYGRADKFHDAEGYRNVDMFHEVDGYCKSDKFPEAEGYRNADKFQEAEGYRNSTKFQEPEGYCNAEKFQEAEGYRNSAKFQEAEGYRNSAKFQEAEGYRNSAKFQEVEGYRSTAKFQELEGYRSTAKFQESEGYRTADKFHEVDGFRDHGYERTGRFPIQERNVAADDDFDYRNKSHERSRSRDFEYSRHDENSSDYERGKRDRKRRRPRDREQERGRSRERERSIDRDRYRERSRSYSHDDHRWRSISPYIHSRGRREYSDDESRSEIRYERSTKKRDHDAKGYNNDRSAVAPSATLVVRGLSQKTVEDDLYHALKDWGPLRHVRVIKEKSSGVSRGFAFIDFPSVDAAQKMMADIGEKGVVVDGRCLFFEYSSKPTGGVGSLLVASASSTQGSASSAPKGSTPIAAAAVDWTCNVCGCVNFARRTSCFQCNEARTEDALPGDAATSNHTLSRKAGEAGPTHVLVVRGLDEYVNEEDLHYEFSKHAPIKDLRLVRDKFTHVSRGFAFIHFHSVEDATKALESSNGKALEKNGNVLRVAYAKSIHGPGANASSSQASSLAAAAIEAATFAQQYDQVGWAPKEYNPDQENKRAQEGNGTSEGGTNPGPSTATGIHPGFVWDEASGYYYDAASGFYYDHHRALYYDGNNSIWYTYNYETQQYEPYADQSGGAVAGMKNTTIAAKARIEKASEASTKSKAVISAPPATIHEPAFPAAVQAAASAANASTRKEREKEIRLASKGLLLAGKKRMSSNISVWKQRKQDTQAAVIAETPSLAKTSTASVSNEKREPEAVVSTVSTSSTTVPLQAKIGTKKLEGVIHTKEGGGGGGATTSRIKNISGKLSGTIYGGKYSTPEALASLRQQVPPTAPSDIGDPTGFGKGNEPLVTTSTQQQKQQIASESISTSTPFKTGLSALGGPSGSNAGGAGGRRRFMEAPQPGTYRDRAAERRSLYGS